MWPPRPPLPGVVSGVDEFALSCADTQLLVTRYAVDPSPVRLVVVAGIGLPVLGLVYIAWARRRAGSGRAAVRL
jgi:hypothetical protein